VCDKTFTLSEISAQIQSWKRNLLNKLRLIIGVRFIPVVIGSKFPWLHPPNACGASDGVAISCQIGAHESCAYYKQCSTEYSILSMANFNAGRPGPFPYWL
jgi:hypothetical protein